MATIGNLVVELKSNSSKLRSGLTKAQRTVGRWAKKAANTIKSVGKAFAFLSAAAIGGFLVAINKTAAGIDNLAKTASKLGTSVGAIQKMGFIFERTGISIETGNTALQRMVRRVSEAAQGTGVAVKALDELGLSAEEMAKLKPEEQFKKISQAMKGVASQGDKVRLAMQFFDTEGVALVNTMAANIDALGKEFESLGITITDQQAKQVEAFNDMKTVLGTLFKGFAQQVTAEVAPAFTAIIKFIKDSVIEMGGMRDAAKQFAIFIIEAARVGVQSISGLVKIFRNLSLMIDKAFIALQRFVQLIPATHLIDLAAGFDRFEFVRQLEADVAKRELSIGQQTSFERNLDQLSGKLQGLIRDGGVGNQGPTQEINLNLQTDTGKTVLKLWSNKEFARRLKAAIGDQANNAARAGAGG